MAPVSPTIRRPTRTSPLMAPSICRSPEPVMLPSNWRSDDRVDRPRWLTGAGAAGRGAAAGPPGAGRMAEPLLARGSGDGTGDLVLLNKLVSSSHEAGGVLRAAVHPDLVVQMNAG